MRVDEATVQQWAELALKVRAFDDIVERCSRPQLGSYFNLVDDAYPREAFSQWTREGLRSALDHIRIWANHAVPLEQPEGVVVHHEGFRWSFTLMRGAIEGAAQSLWLSRAKTVDVAKARLVRAVRHDLREQRLAWHAMGSDVGPVDARAVFHEAAAAELVEFGPNTDRLPSMVSMIRDAATETDQDPDLHEANWRVCSAAAHGKDWAILELQTFVDRVEWRPGQYHSAGHPDPDRLTEILDDAISLLSLAGIQYLLGSGYDPALEIRRSVVVAARKMPQKDGGAHVEKTAKLFDVD